MWTKVPHDPVFLLVFKVYCGTCDGGIFVLRQRNLSKLCLPGLLCFSMKINLTVCIVKRFKDCNTKLDSTRLLSVRILVYLAAPDVEKINFNSKTELSNSKELYFLSKNKYNTFPER